MFDKFVILCLISKDLFFIVTFPLNLIKNSSLTPKNRSHLDDRANARSGADQWPLQES